MMPCNRAIMAILLASGMPTINAQEANTVISKTATSMIETINVYGRQQNDNIDDIPQSIAVYGRESFEIGLYDSVGDVLRLVPNATRLGSSLDMFADDYFFRGFNAEQSTNGLGFTQTDHPADLANVERIEILKGPSSVLYGQMEPGGTINVVTKQPLNEFYSQAGVQYGSENHIRSTLDVTGPLSDNIRARVNLAYQESDSFVDFLAQQRVFVAPNLTVDLSDKTNLTIEGHYSANEWTAINGGTPVAGAITDNPNGNYDKSFNPAFKDSFTERDSRSINVRLTHALTDTIQARASYTYVNNEADWQEYGPFGLDTDSRTLARIIFAGTDTYKKDHNVILDISGEIDTGALTHKFIVGLDYRDDKLSRPTRVYNRIDPVDLYNPQYSAIDLNTANLARDRTTLQNDDVIAAFIQDRVTLAERWHLLAGLRYIDSQLSQATINNLNPGSEPVKDGINQNDWTTQFGLVYDLTDTASLFINRSESFVPQQGTTSGQEPLEAEEGIQYELGTRFVIGDIHISIAGFEITKDNIAIEDPLNDDFEVAAGKARSKGFELTAGGYIRSNWYLSAAYGYTDTEILKSDDAQLEGNRFVNIPRHTASLQSRYTVKHIPGLSLGGTVTYMDDRFGDDENSFKIPGHTRVDLAAYYEINDALQVDVLLDNVFDEDIFSPGSFAGIIREPGRTYMTRVTYSF